jgi:hypothetical protein
MYQRLIFTKILSRTDVEHRMAIPMGSFDVFQIPQGEHSKQFDVIDMIKTGHSWSFRCSTRKKDFYPKPVLSSGWIEYIREKDLREGDQVSFFLVQKDGEEGLRLGVQAQKKLIRLGVKIVGLLLFEEEEGRRRRRSI